MLPPSTAQGRWPSHQKFLFFFSPGGTDSAAETCYTVSIQYSKWSLKQNLIPKQDLGTARLSVPRRVFVETSKMFQGLMNG